MGKTKHKVTTSVEKSKRYQLIIPSAAILSAIFLYIFIQLYAENFRGAFAAETSAYMLEIAQQVTLVMNDRVSANLKNVETDAVAISRMELENTSDVIAFLNEEADRYGYSKLSLAGVDGIALANNGETFNAAMRKHFLSAYKGTPSVSGLLTSDYSNTDSIEFAVPVKDGEKVTGVLLATY